MKMIHKILISAGIAAILEGITIAVFICFGAIGAEGPDTVGLIFMIFHFPGIMLADAMHLEIVVIFIGFLQYFVVTFLVVEIWSRRKKKY